MSAKVLDGRSVAASMLERVRREVTGFVAVYGRSPILATVFVGDDPASHTYVRMKANRCAKVGIQSRRIELDASITTGELVARIEQLSADSSVDGILLQHPVPGHIDERAAFEAIAPSKDVDGVTRTSFVVVGRSPILGKPAGMLLLARDATVTYCHSRTADLAHHVAEADVVITPVPGGVGPMTIATLLAQTIRAARNHETARQRGVVPVKG